MAVAAAPFDLVDAKLAAPSARPGTVAKADAIDRLCESSSVTGAARVVQCAPKVALALGYDVDAALERRDL